MAAAAATYQRVLKALEKHVGKGANKQHFRDFVAAEFRKPVDPDTDAAGRIRLAGDYAYLLASVHHHKLGGMNGATARKLLYGYFGKLRRCSTRSL